MRMRKASCEVRMILDELLLLCLIGCCLRPGTRKGQIVIEKELGSSL